MIEPVLILNANFEPLSVISTRRALGLIVAGKAEMLANGRGYIHTVRKAYPRPSIIRLAYMVRRPRPHVRLSKREIFRRDHYTCQYCGSRSGRMTIDHLVPRHLGGDHSWTNLVTACPACNLKKGGRPLEHARMSLLRQPREPRATAWYLFSNHLEANQEWEPYISGW
jgi:5-methylcytosine-specific restriction endonuclease McrA